MTTLQQQVVQRLTGARTFGTGKLIKIRGEVPGLEIFGDPLPSALAITILDDRRDLLEGNLLLLKGRRFWIAGREPQAPVAGQTNIKVELRADRSSRRQRRDAIKTAKQYKRSVVKVKSE